MFYIVKKKKNTEFWKIARTKTCILTTYDFVQQIFHGNLEVRQFRSSSKKGRVPKIKRHFLYSLRTLLIFKVSSLKVRYT